MRSSQRGNKSSSGSSSSGGWSFSPVKCFFFLAFSVACVLFLMILPFSPLNVFHHTSTDQNTATNTPNGVLQTYPVATVDKTPNLRVETPDIAAVRTPNPKTKPRIAFAITVTKDGPFVDGALVLGYAAKKYHSFRMGSQSAYDVDLVAFVTKKVSTTRTILAQFGWRILEKDLPVELEEIENKAYAEAMRNSGCCGADEFLKLWAYTLTDYHRVVHLDMDSIVFRTMDEIFNMDYEALYTGDYNMKGHSPVAPAQGGFLVITPNVQRFEEYRAIIRKGDHRPNGGWGGSKIGNFWGGQTIQGIIPYFYHDIHPGASMELNRCKYNNMVDNPYYPETTRCIDGSKVCEDCRQSDPEKVSSAHFTICQKPWTCTAHTNPRNKVVCEAFHQKWFTLRDEYEQQLGIDTSYRVHREPYKQFLGMCKSYGDRNYIPLPIDKVTKQPDF